MKNIYKTALLFLFAVAFLQNGISQKPEKWTSADIYHALKKANTLGSALYIAAHPDDENTRLISHLSNGMYMNTAYLSLTRGDGGQNLIGTQIQELLGLIRTQELLGARRIDGGKQMFSRANDFGYSKTSDETQLIWDKEQVMADMVWAIRKWRPDVIINRFDHNSNGKTHGHHSSSAELSVQVFDMAADPNAFPEQLKYVDTWQPKRLFFNTSWWFYGGRDKFEAADKSNMVAVDAGQYYPLKGKSNNEIAAESRSMHKSQGFGSVGTRGGEMEYLDFIKGDKPSSNADLFDGINTSWTRVKGGDQIGMVLNRTLQSFDYENPALSVQPLLQAYKLIQNIEDEYWKKVKSEEVKNLIAACMGLFMEAVANDHSATPGQQIELAVEAINRSEVDCRLVSVEYLPLGQDTAINSPLVNNEVMKYWKKMTLPTDMPTTNPYWLDKKWALGMYNVEDQLLRGLPETPRVFKAKFNYIIMGEPISFEKEVVHKFDDDVKGEVYRPFEITPPVAVSLLNEVYLFTKNEPQAIDVLVKSGKENVDGNVTLCHPEGWKIEPEKIDFNLKLKGEEQLFTFKLSPPEDSDENYIVPLAMVGEEGYTKKMVTIEYDHIPTQTVFLDASAKAAKMDLKIAGSRIGYVMGAGDKIPESLRQIGYRVDVLEDNQLTAENLKQYDAVVVGVRAYNVVERLKFRQANLMEYVKNGGTMIVQYNTSRETVVPEEEIGPYPLKLSRDRVSVEDAEVRILAPDHDVLNWPNKITQKDFENWIQERGLYFPNEWAAEYTPILSSNDPGEPARDGGLLVAQYGNGYYVYTGYSWFRELPAGVTGAYRIFANMIGLGKRDKP